MGISRKQGLTAAGLLALAACAPEETPEANAAAAAQPQNRAGIGNVAAADDGAAEATGTETLQASFTGWETGDYVWAVLEVPGRDPVSAWAEPPVSHFLTATRGQRLTVGLRTERTEIPEAGGEVDVATIVSARTADTDAARWWAALGPEERQAAERRTEEAQYPPAERP